MSSFSNDPDDEIPIGRRMSGLPFQPIPTSPPQAPPGDGERPQFRPQILRSLRMHPMLAGGVAAAVLCVMLGLAALERKVYLAQSLVYVEPVVARNLNEPGAPDFDQFRYGSFIDQQMQTVTRQDVLTDALNTLPAGTWRGPTESEASAVQRLQKALVVERLLTSYQMSIKLKANSPKSAAAVVNAVTLAYLQSGRRDELNMSRERQALLQDERTRIRAQLDIDQKEQALLGNKLGVANPEQSIANPFDADTANLRLQLANARQARDVAEAQLASVSGKDATHQSGLAATADETLGTDLGLSSMKTAVNARRALIESDMAGLTQSNPRYLQDKDELADLDRSVEAMTAQLRTTAEHHIQDKLATDFRRTAEIEAHLNNQLAAQTSKAAGAGPKLQRASVLAVDIQRLNAQYTSVDDALNALDLQTNGPGMAHVALTATPPAGPEPGNRMLFLFAALPLACVCAACAAVAARLLKRRIYIAADLEEAAGFAPMTVIPKRSDVPQAVFEEYVLRLAAAIENAYRTGGARTFVLTPVSLHTEIHSLVGSLRTRLESLRLDVAVRQTGELVTTSQETMEHFAYNAAGIEAARIAGEGIAVSKLQRLKKVHGIILIDAAPILHSAETEYAARCADATILLARSGVTLYIEVQSAITLLSRLRVQGVATVLEELQPRYADSAFRFAVNVAEKRELARPQNHRSVAIKRDVPIREFAQLSTAERPAEEPSSHYEREAHVAAGSVMEESSDAGEASVPGSNRPVFTAQGDVSENDAHDANAVDQHDVPTLC